jgi:hypothetical protein
VYDNLGRAHKREEEEAIKLFLRVPHSAKFRVENLTDFDSTKFSIFHFATEILRRSRRKRGSEWLRLKSSKNLLFLTCV